MKKELSPVVVVVAIVIVVLVAGGLLWRGTAGKSAQGKVDSQTMADAMRKAGMGGSAPPGRDPLGRPMPDAPPAPAPTGR